MNLVLASEWEDSSEEWLIPSLLCDSLTLLSGEPKTGKTALACHLVRSLITKIEILGMHPTQKEMKVAWMGFDCNWRREVKERLSDLSDQIYFPNTVDYKQEDEWKDLANQMKEKGINFLVIDHLYGLSAGADLDRQNQVQSVYAPVMKLIETTGAAVLLLTQAPKGGGGRAAHSVASEGLARWLLRLTGSGKIKKLIALGNNGEPKTFKMELTPFKIQLQSSKSTTDLYEARPADGGLPDRARYIIENAPEEALLGVKQLGIWFGSQDKGRKGSESGRSAINDLIKGGLLAREGRRGKIVCGPNLVA
jgi:hypothetical protein